MKKNGDLSKKEIMEIEKHVEIATSCLMHAIGMFEDAIESYEHLLIERNYSRLERALDIDADRAECLGLARHVCEAEGLKFYWK